MSDSIAQIDVSDLMALVKSAERELEALSMLDGFAPRRHHDLHDVVQRARDAIGDERWQSSLPSDKKQ